MEQRSSGPQALDALLELFGNLFAQIEELVTLLQLKGVITEDDWDTVMSGRFASMTTFDEWARRHLEPEDNEALDVFFGN
jgi:hypothetical protein